MNFLPKTVDSQFLVRVIRNEVGPEEREFFEKWLETSEENKEEFSSLMLLWDKFQYSHLPLPPSQQEQWEIIESAISYPEHSDLESFELSSYQSRSSDIKFHSYVSEKKKPVISWFYRAAAVLIISIGLFLIYDSAKVDNKPVITKDFSVPPVIKYYTLSTEKGQKATLSLSDGSVIHLNSESKLIYPNYFGTDSREVEFQGEGYFKIFPNASKPFQVKCSNITTLVTGTEFNIKNRENGFSVTVVEGSVKTFSGQSPLGVSVEKGEMVMLKSSGKFSHPVKVDMNHFLAWRSNKIAFSRTPLKEAAAELQRCYSNIKVNFLTDSIKNKTITGVFDTNSLDDILSIMSLTLDIRINRTGNQVYFE